MQTPQVRVNQSSQPPAASQTQNGGIHVSEHATHARRKEPDAHRLRFQSLTGMHDWTTWQLFQMACQAVAFHRAAIEKLALDSRTDEESAIDLLELLKIEEQTHHHRWAPTGFARAGDAPLIVVFDGFGLLCQARLSFDTLAHQAFFTIFNHRRALHQIATADTDRESSFALAETLAVIEQWAASQGVAADDEGNSIEPNSELQVAACTAYAKLLRSRAKFASDARAKMEKSQTNHSARRDERSAR